jgi:mannitol-1-phosphate/altronate dehydrogenase
VQRSARSGAKPGLVPLRGTSLADLPERVRRPGYDRGRVRAGIAHFSVGNFHRAHQAAYVDRCLALPGQEGWGIAGIGLIDDAAERAKAVGMAEQDGLYTLTLFPPRGEPESRIVGAIVEYLFAPADPAAVLAKLRDPAIRIVSMTITEGGYNIDEAMGEFRLDAPDVARDLGHPEAPRTVFGFVAEALARRRADGLPPFTVLSCDNLPHNGDVARRAILAFAAARDAGLADWIAGNAAFPNCMVDRITPAVTLADVAQLNALTGVDDRLPVFAEEFEQWVVEDRFCADRPALEQVGVQFVHDVAGYEQIKLRMLNASHTMLSYPGLLGGYRLVHEAMADPRILGYLRDFLDRDVIPLLAAPPGMDLEAYRDTVLARFANPAVNDQLLRITSDGASKIPVFLGGTLRACLERNGDHRRIAFLLAAFARYLGGRDDRGAAFGPIEPHLAPADRALAADADPAAVLRIANFQGLGVQGAPGFVATFARYRALLAERGALAALDDLLES